MSERAFGTQLDSVSLHRKNMRVVILQPSYLPWLGYFDQMAAADRFVYLDDVQFTRRDWRNRNKIRTKEGWAWLTVPVLNKGRFDQSLKETRIDNSSQWRRKHREAIRSNYGRTPFFDKYFPCFEPIYNKEWDFLVDLCYETIFQIKEQLEIGTPIQNSSEFKAEGSGCGRIFSLCRQLHATHYLSGDAGEKYLSPEEFQKRGLALEFHDYQHPEYDQVFPGFIPYLSAMDLLFNCGENSLDILRQGENREP